MVQLAILGTVALARSPRATPKNASEGERVGEVLKGKRWPGSGGGKPRSDTCLAAGRHRLGEVLKDKRWPGSGGGKPRSDTCLAAGRHRLGEVLKDKRWPGSEGRQAQVRHLSRSWAPSPCHRLGEVLKGKRWPGSEGRQAQVRLVLRRWRSMPEIVVGLGDVGWDLETHRWIESMPKLTPEALYHQLVKLVEETPDFDSELTPS